LKKVISQSEAAMTSIDHDDPPSHPTNPFAIAVLLSGLANAATEVCEKGDPLCAVPDPQLEKPNGYELDRDDLNSFVIWMYGTLEQYGRELLDNSACLKCELR
jgi:hypothetical protein